MTDYTKNFEQVKEYIRGANPLCEVASMYIDLPTSAKKAILCFVHNEQTPSCHLHPSEEYFKCFGCDKVIDVFALVMHFEKLDFMGSLRFLANRANITLPNYSKQENDSLTKSLQQKHEEAELFETVLSIIKAQQIANSDYLVKRGIGKETTQKCECYECNLSVEEINKMLTEKGFSQKLIDASYLLHDTRFFENSVIFPIRMRGKIVTFCSRTLTDREPKYLYLKDHSKGIFNYDEAVSQEVILICEAPIDAMTLVDHGFMGSVSLGSCNASEDQVITLKKLQSKNIYICFDNDADNKDNPGLNGAIRLAKALGGGKK